MSSLTPQQRVVVVLGMHRSGTSLLANLLTALGVDLGDNLLPADAGNQAGYWEQQDIFQTQDEMLKRLGRQWSGPSGSLPLPADWWRLPEVAPFKERLISIVRSELSRARGTWGFKDPRTSRTLPLWKEIFAELRLDPVYILAVRDPQSVIESVSLRDEIPASRAELLWLLHNLDSVRDAGGKLGAVVDYDRWFSHPREQAQAVARALGTPWPDDDRALLDAVRGRIRPDLRHYQSPRPLSLPFTGETYQVLLRAADEGRLPQGLNRLDDAVRQSLALCAPWCESLSEFMRPRFAPQFRFVEHFPEARLESVGSTAQSAVWDVTLDDVVSPSLFLHPPARLFYRVADGRCARLSFAVCMHPDVWTKPQSGGCEFIVTVNGAVYSSVTLDPVNQPADRRWHEFDLAIPASPTGSHEVIFETRSLGHSFDSRWAMWRDPRMTWESPAPVAAAPAEPGRAAIPRFPEPALPALPRPVAAAVHACGSFDAEDLKRSARSHLAAGNHEAARAECRRVLMDNPADRAALALLAECHFDISTVAGSATSRRTDTRAYG
ncbi:MAG: sulfotransferase [Verrucomicrobiota bacterium]